MRIGKNMIVAIMITFCFTASLLMAIPIRSANSPYDPWLDYNSDGKISLQDLVSLANSYGTTGDPTKNVTVTNPVIYVNGTNPMDDYSVQSGTINFTSQTMILSVLPIIFCGGYSRLSVLFRPRDVGIGSNNNITIYLGELDWMDNTGTYDTYEMVSTLNNKPFNATIYSDASGHMLGYNIPQYYMTETKAPYCRLWLSPVEIYPSLPPNWWVVFDYAVYLRNE